MGRNVRNQPYVQVPLDVYKKLTAKEIDNTVMYDLTGIAVWDVSCIKCSGQVFPADTFDYECCDIRYSHFHVYGETDIRFATNHEVCKVQKRGVYHVLGCVTVALFNRATIGRVVLKDWSPLATESVQQNQ